MVYNRAVIESEYHIMYDYIMYDYIMCDDMTIERNDIIYGRNLESARWHMKNRYFKKTVSAVLAAVLTVCMAGCGGSGAGAGTGGKTESENTGNGAEGYVWVPAYYDLPGTENPEESYVTDIQFQNGKCYYTLVRYGEDVATDICALDMADPAGAPEVLYTYRTDPMEEPGEFSVSYGSFRPTPDGGVLMLRTTMPNVQDGDPSAWERARSQQTYELVKVDAQGEEVFCTDITEKVKMDPNSSYVNGILINQEGKIFLYNSSSYIWVYEADGTWAEDISMESGGWINGIGFDGDGRLVLMQNGGSAELIVYDEEKKAFSQPLENLPPNVYNSGVTAGPDGSILLEGNNSLYAYYPDTTTYTEVVKWLDCDMMADYVDTAAMLDEETIAVYYRNWNTSENNIVVLKKTPASQVAEKQILTLGCMSLSQNLEMAVVAFNRNSSEYRVEIKNYSEAVDWSQENALEVMNAAQTQMNNDILTGNAPDMFVAADINLQLFAIKGVIEDLNPYLDASGAVNREDFFAPVLDACTVDGILCMIPQSFSVNTVVGRTSEVGSEPGWSVDEMLAFADKNPDAALFANASKLSILSECLMYDFSSYLNWETGECAFDSDNFKKILEFANRYPAEADYSVSEPSLIGSHAVLLRELGLSNVQEWQLSEMMFGEPVTAIGFPSSSGTGVVASQTDGVCISASSSNKEACWSFLESLLGKESMNNRSMWGFPIRRDAFEEELEEEMKADYQLDENGNPMLDENGEPIEISHYSYGWDDVNFQLYAATEEDAQAVYDIIDRISGLSNSYDEQIMSIIEEECGAYFAGQKSVDEVAGIVQSRIQTYVNESR